MSGEPPKNSARFLEWDTEFFGMRIASLQADAISDAVWRDQLAWCRSEHIQCLYVLMNGDDTTSANNTGLRDAAHLDERITYERETLPLPEPKPCKATIRLARQEDTPVLRALAMVAHKDSRFWKDGRFSEERCAELYAIWIERSIRGWADAVFVAAKQGVPVGYITGHARADGRAEIGLVAVADGGRGEGLGRALVRRFLSWAAERGLVRSSVVTQGFNVPAMSLYKAAGFRLARTQRWYHLWFVHP